MPPAQRIIASEGMSGVLNLKRSKVPGRRGEGKWKKKFAMLKTETLHLYEGHDENGKGEDESHTVYLSKYKECTHIVDKKGRRKPGFILIPTDSTYEQWMLSCEDISRQEKWISQLNGAITGNTITIVSFNFDDLTVQSPTLFHPSKTRPKCKGRRAPSKRPRMAMSADNGDIFSPDEIEAGVTTVDSVNPAKKPRSDLTTSTSPARTPDESKASTAKAFFRGIGLKFTTALGRQKSTGAKTPQSPEPEGARAVDIAPEDRMTLSGLMRTLRRIEEQSGTIVNKAAALQVLFQGAAADSASLGRPAVEVQRGLQGITDTLEHLNLAEDLQIKVKENEERERMTKDELAKKRRDEEEAKRMQEEDDKKKRVEEEAEQRRRDEEEQELTDEEDRKREEETVKREEEEQRAKEEALRLAEKAGAEEEEMWQSEDEEKAGSTDEGEVAPKETSQEASESNKDSEGNEATNDESKMDLEMPKESLPDEAEETKMDTEETKVDTLKDENISEQQKTVEETDDGKSPSPEVDETELNVHL